MRGLIARRQEQVGSNEAAVENALSVAKEVADVAVLHDILFAFNA